MNKKFLILAVISSFLLLTLVNASIPNLGVFRADDSIELIQSCVINGTFCTSCNISSVDYPNGTRAVKNIVMTKRTGDFNYTLLPEFTDQSGTYRVNGYCQYQNVLKNWAYYFEVNLTGESRDLTKGALYISLIGVFIFLFIINLYSIGKLPTGNDTDDYGRLLGINKLKYMKPVLWAVAWGLLLIIVFTSSNLALIYINDQLFGDLLFNFWQIMMALTLPMFIIWLLYIFVQIFRDKEIKKLLERGIDVHNTP